MVKKNEYFLKSETVEIDGKQVRRTVQVKKELRWRVIFGYAPTDYIVVGEEDLEKVKYAWLTKGVYKAKLSGSEIKRIEPDWRYYTGWSDGYEPKYADDFRQIREDTPTHLIEERERIADARVRYVIQSAKPELLQSLEKVDQLLPEAERPRIGNGSDIKTLTAGLAEKFKV